MTGRFWTPPNITKTWSCAKGLFYSLMAKECSLSRQLWVNDLFPKFFQTCTHLARMRLSDPPECECTSSEKEARAKFSLSSLIKEQVFFFLHWRSFVTIIFIFSGVLRIKHKSNNIYVRDGIQSCAHHLTIRDICVWKSFVRSWYKNYNTAVSPGPLIWLTE